MRYKLNSRIKRNDENRNPQKNQRMKKKIPITPSIS